VPLLLAHATLVGLGVLLRSLPAHVLVLNSFFLPAPRLQKKGEIKVAETVVKLSEVVIKTEFSGNPDQFEVGTRLTIRGYILITNAITKSC
jgi:hypothetical protein